MSLSDPNAPTRAAAAWQLAGAQESIEDVTTALEGLEADSDKTVRYAAAWSLGHLHPRCCCAPGSVPARLTRRTQPRYPQDAFVAKIEGVVLVELLVGEQGEVAHAEIRRSIPELDATALACVRQWQFEPCRVNGNARAIVARAPVTFRIY